MVLSTLCSCNRNSKESDKYEFKNKTAISDKTYNSLRLYKIDTITGFDEYFQDLENCNTARYVYFLLHAPEGMGTNNLYFFDLNNIEELFEYLEFKDFMIENYLSTTKTKIYLNSKNNTIISAWYEGTQNQALLSLREGADFDIHWTSAFSNTLFEGTYRMNSDTVFLSFNSESPTRVGDTLIVNDGFLVPINYMDESLNYNTPFKILEMQDDK